jgi:organic radical activating enzyme
MLKVAHRWDSLSVDKMKIIHVSSVTKHFLNSPSYIRGTNDNASKHSCTVPYKTVSVSLDGDCYLCSCEAWLPIPVGNILDFSKLEDIWTSNYANKLQHTVANKEYTYCATSHCGINHRDVHSNSPGYNIYLNIDDSCNLACPSCRKTAKMHIDGPLFHSKQLQIYHMIDLINNTDSPVTIIMIGSGDPLASYIVRPLLKKLKLADNKKIILFTNGLLLKKVLPETNIVDSIIQYSISIDAGSKEVYEQVRKPGKFEVLIDNLEWLQQTNNNKVEVVLKFCLSAVNAHDVIAFEKLCNRLGFIGEITKLDDWGTFDNFSEHAVLDNPSHPLYNVAIEQLRAVASSPNIVFNSYIKRLL